MEFFVDVAQTLAGDVRVNLRGADAGVAEQFLNHAQVRAVFQKMRGETMAQHVRRDVAFDAGAFDAVFDSLPQSDGGKRCATIRQKKIRRRFCIHEFLPARIEKMLNRINGFFSNRHDALFISFADDVDETGFQMKLLQTDIAQFGEAQT